MTKESLEAYITFITIHISLRTTSFQSVMNFIELRDEPTSQWEIQEYRNATLKEIMYDVSRNYQIVE